MINLIILLIFFDVIIIVIFVLIIVIIIVAIVMIIITSSPPPAAAASQKPSAPTAGKWDCVPCSIPKIDSMWMGGDSVMLRERVRGLKGVVVVLPR